MLRISLQSHSTICIFTRSHQKMWVPYVTGTPKMSQIGSLIYGITQLRKVGEGMGWRTCKDWQLYRRGFHQCSPVYTPSPSHPPPPPPRHFHSHSFMSPLREGDRKLNFSRICNDRQLDERELCMA